MLYITVMLYGKQGIKGEFREYETKALNIFKNYGGEIITAYAPLNDGSQEETPDEIQILKIENKAELEKFMNDPDRIKIADERNAVIRKTELYLSDEIVQY
jgi:uncharacterized protein (DUF1330 family)